MKSPGFHAANLIKIPFGFAETLERLASVHGEDKWLRLFHALEDSDRLLRQVNDVRLAVLGPGLGQGPNLTFEVKFVRGALGNLFAALPSQSEELDDSAVWPPEFPGSDDHPSKLIVTKHPVSGSFLGGQWDPVSRGLIQH